MITSIVFVAQHLQSETSGASADVVYDRQQLLSPRTCLWESGCKSFDTNRWHAVPRILPSDDTRQRLFYQKDSVRATQALPLDFMNSSTF